MLVLIDEILTFARLEAGRDEVHPAPVMLHDIVDQAVSIVGPQAVMRGLAVRVELPPIVVDEARERRGVTADRRRDLGRLGPCP